MKKTLQVVLLALVAFIVFAPAASATQPDPEHKVTICHAKPADTAAQGWVSITVDVASVGYQHSGHESEHDSDIIPAYSYDDFTYDGKNLTTDFQGSTGEEILANGCVDPADPVDPVRTQVSVDFFDPTCKEPTAGVLSEFNPQEVTVAATGERAPGETFTLEFTAKPGYVITTETVFTHTYGAVPTNCDKPDKPDDPKVDKPDKPTHEPKTDKPDPKPEPKTTPVAAPELPHTGVGNVLLTVGVALGLILFGASLIVWAANHRP